MSKFSLYGKDCSIFSKAEAEPEAMVRSQLVLFLSHSLTFDFSDFSEAVSPRRNQCK
jgi:hypothetical protein